MKLPIRNFGSKPLQLVIEVHCDEYKVPVNGEAIVTLDDGPPHSIDVYDNQIRVWNEGSDSADVEIIQRSPLARD